MYSCSPGLDLTLCLMFACRRFEKRFLQETANFYENGAFPTAIIASSWLVVHDACYTVWLTYAYRFDLFLLLLMLLLLLTRRGSAFDRHAVSAGVPATRTAQAR